MTLNSHITHRHQIIPRFIPEGELAGRLLGVGKDTSGLYTPQEQNSVYQSAIHTVELDVKRIAYASYLSEDVVRSGIKALFKAICDITYQARDLRLNFDIATVNIVDKQLSVNFSDSVFRVLNSEAFERGIVESRFKNTKFYRGE